MSGKYEYQHNWNGCECRDPILCKCPCHRDKYPTLDGIKIPDESLESQLHSAKAEIERLRGALEKIANDREFCENVRGEFIRKVWYVEEAKRALSGPLGEGKDLEG